MLVKMSMSLRNWCISCRVSDTCVYNVPNFASAAIVSIVTQQTIGEPPPLRYQCCDLH